jgi:hypothetical protein
VEIIFSQIKHDFPFIKLALNLVYLNNTLELWGGYHDLVVSDQSRVSLLVVPVGLSIFGHCSFVYTDSVLISYGQIVDIATNVLFLGNTLLTADLPLDLNFLLH